MLVFYRIVSFQERIEACSEAFRDGFMTKKQFWS